MEGTVLGIVGSYRRHGTVDRAVAAVLDGAREAAAGEPRCALTGGRGCRAVVDFIGPCCRKESPS